MHKADAVLDTDMLEQYIISSWWDRSLSAMVAVFEEDDAGLHVRSGVYLTARDQRDCRRGHKIKGAAGSIGLRHGQQLGQRIRTGSACWQSDNVAEWVEEMKSSGKTM